MLRKKEERKGSECDGDIDNGGNGGVASTAAAAANSSNGSNPTASSSAAVSEETGRRRTWEQWSSEDKVKMPTISIFLGHCH